MQSYFARVPPATQQNVDVVDDGSPPLAPEQETNQSPPPPSQGTEQNTAGTRVSAAQVQFYPLVIAIESSEPPNLEQGTVGIEEEIVDQDSNHVLDPDEDIIVDPGLRKPIDEMLCYIEREVFLKLKDDDILHHFHEMKSLFFCEREDILNSSTVHPPFYKQDPEEKENYKGAPTTTVHLPQLLRHPVRQLHRQQPPPPNMPRDPKPWKSHKIHRLIHYQTARFR